MKLQPVKQTAKGIIAGLLSQGYSCGEINMALSIAKKTIKKDAQ